MSRQRKRPLRAFKAVLEPFLWSGLLAHRQACPSHHFVQGLRKEKKEEKKEPKKRRKKRKEQ
jgi:hypothetical protein